MKGVAIISPKGGTGKSTLAHLLAYGAAWRQVPAYLMHTDEREPMVVDGRPYAYIDARNPETLSTVMGSMVNSNGLCVVDGGGNRPDFDKWIAEYVDLVIIPVIADTEAVELANETMKRLEKSGIKNARFVLNMVSTNEKARLRDFQQYFSQLEKGKIIGQIKEARAVKRLREPDDKEPFQTLPSNINNLARSMYSVIVDALDEAPQVRLDVEIA